MEEHCNLGLNCQYSLRLPVPAGIKNLTGSSFRIDGSQRKHVTDAEPSVFGSMLSFEMRLRGLPVLIKTRTNSRHNDAISGEFSLSPSEKPVSANLLQE